MLCCGLGGKQPQSLLEKVEPSIKPKRVKDIKKEYAGWEHLGHGATSDVYKVKKDGKELAAKLVKRHEYDCIELLNREIDILQQLEHDNIIMFHQWIMDRRYSVCVMEMLTGGELFDEIIKHYRKTRKCFSEDILRFVIRELLEPVNYLHSKNIAHIDIKPENFVLRCPGLTSDPPNIVLVDFGTAKQVDLEIEYVNTGGTIAYMPPEAFKPNVERPMKNKRSGEDLLAGDMYAIGVIFYVLLTGSLPYVHSNQKMLRTSILNSKISWFRVKECPTPAQSLLKKLLIHDPKKRLRAKDMIQDKWLEDATKMMQKSSKNAQKKMRLHAICGAMEAFAIKENKKKIQEVGSIFDDHIKQINGETEGDIIKRGKMCDYLYEHKYSEAKIKQTVDNIFEELNIGEDDMKIQQLRDEWILFTLAKDEVYRQEILDTFGTENTKIIKINTLKEKIGEEIIDEIMSVFNLQEGQDLAYKIIEDAIQQKKHSQNIKDLFSNFQLQTIENRAASTLDDNGSS